MTRRSISTRERVRIFERAGGVCHLCGLRIHAGEAWDVSHPIPLAIGGADDDTNREPAHRKCHRVETTTKDAPRIAKTKRQYAANIGAKQRGCGFPPPARNGRASAPMMKPPVPRRMIEAARKGD